MRSIKLVAGALVLAGAAVVPSAAAFGSSTPAGGTVHVFVNLSPSGLGGTILLTGAIGDYGTVKPINTNGTPSSNPDATYNLVRLKQGTFRVNLSAVNEKSNSINPPFNKTTCSASASVSAPIKLSDGSGLYKGISGTVNITVAFAVILPHYTSGADKGQCNESNSAQAVAQYSEAAGTGTVSFG